MKYHSLFFQKLGKMSHNVSSAAVRIGALRVNTLLVVNELNVPYHQITLPISPLSGPVYDVNW